MVTYGEAFAVQPFGNTLVTMTLTGAQIETVLEQQWAIRSGTETVPAPRHLQRADLLLLGGCPARATGSTRRRSSSTEYLIDPAASYRVTVNSFLADGGDSFVELKNGHEPDGRRRRPRRVRRLPRGQQPGHRAGPEPRDPAAVGSRTTRQQDSRTGGASSVRHHPFPRQRTVAIRWTASVRVARLVARLRRT